MKSMLNRRIVTQNLYKGESVLRDFNTQYPYLKSNTKYNHLIDLHKNNEQYAKLIPIIKGKSILAGFVLNQIRNTYKQTTDKITYLKNAVKHQKTANCQECAFLVHNKLSEQGILAQNVRMNFVTKGTDKIPKNHAFTVIGLDKEADITRPNTWGKNAVIVDAWTNTVKRARDGIKYIKEFFNFNPEKEDCIYSYHRNS